MQNIRTKWHKLMSLVEQDEVYMTAPIDGGHSEHWDKYKPNKEAVKQLLGVFADLPRFVVNSDLLELVMREGYEKSLLDMKKAGVLRSPFTAMVVEYDVGTARHMVMLRDQTELDYDNQFSWERFEKNGSNFPAPFYGITFRVDKDDDGEYAVMSPSVSTLNMEDRNGEPYIGVSAISQPVFPSSPELENLMKQAWLKDGASLFRAMATAMLVMHTEGVKREVVDCSKMNRARVASNKPPIPRHTVLSIGKVYRSAKSEQSDDYIPRRSPLPHWRRGHIHTVRYGVGRASVKQVYYKPKLVAFKEAIEGDDTPVPSKTYIVTK